MGDHLRYKGKFIKKKVLHKKMNVFKSIIAKKDTESIEPAETNLLEVTRIVDLKELGKKLRCCQCNEVLRLVIILDETRLGLHSFLKIKCTKCNAITQQVSTSKLLVVNDNNRSKYCDITTGVVLGAVHAGYGSSGSNKILACTNIPTISTKLFKLYKREIGLAIEAATQQSCKKAAEEERHLVNENVEKLCEFL